MPLTEDRNTPHKDGELVILGVAAAVILFAGGMVAANAAGSIVPAADAAGLTVMGMAEEQVDNSDGADGELYVGIRRKKAFIFRNSSTNAVTAANHGKDIYVEDDETVSSSGGVNSIVAGKCLAVLDEGVLVAIG